MSRCAAIEQRAARLVEHELKLACPVGGVDVDEDRADLGGGVLGDGPLGAVGRPDANPVPLADARREQAEGESVDLSLQLRVAVAQARGGSSTRASRPGKAATVRSKFAPIVSPSSGVSLVADV